MIVGWCDEESNALLFLFHEYPSILFIYHAMDLSLLLNNEEYQKRFAEGHPSPYTFEVQNGNKAIFYFGVRHSRDPHDAQWNILEEYWERFLTQSAGERVALLEGPAGFSLDTLSRDEVIAKFGEAGLLAMWCKAHDIPYQSADLPLEEEFLKLKESFEGDLVTYFIFARSAGAWLRSGAMGSYDEVITKAVHSTAERIPSASDSLAFYAAMHKKIFERELAESERETLIRAAAPIYHDSVLNDISRASGRVRNEHIVLEIEKQWLTGKSVFVLFGSGHAVIQERVVKELGEV